MVGLEHNYRLYKLGFRCVCLFDFMYGHGVLLNLSGEEKECVHFSFTSSSTTDVNILNDKLKNLNHYLIITNKEYLNFEDLKNPSGSEENLFFLLPGSGLPSVNLSKRFTKLSSDKSS